MSMNVHIEAVDGTRHLRKLTVLADGYGICARVPALNGDRRQHLCRYWTEGGRWFTEHGAIGTESALRDRLASMVVEQGISTDDPDILARAQKIRAWRENAERERAAAERAAAEQRARAHAERERLYSLPLRMRKANVLVATADGMTQGPGWLSVRGIWSIHRLPSGKYRISHEPSGRGAPPLDQDTLRDARAIVAGLEGAGCTDPFADPKAFRETAFSIRDRLRAT